MADTRGRIPFVASANQFIRDLGAYTAKLLATSKYVGLYAPAVWAGDGFATASDKLIRSITTTDSLLSDDFGGNALDIVNNWDVFDGGLPINPTIDGLSAVQAAMGSGITGITHSVAASVLSITMGLVVGAEKWFLSQQTFAGREDILVSFSRDHNLAANSLFIGLVEVDPATLIPIPNPNIAADANGSLEFANRGGVELAQSATATGYRAEAIGDSSSVIAIGNTGVATSLATMQEFTVEVDSRDIVVSTSPEDTAASKAVGASRVSSQCPNDRRLYKLCIRARNLVSPGANSTIFNIGRILVINRYELRAEISSGEGDLAPNKSVGVLLNGSASATQTLGVVSLAPQSGANGGYATLSSKFTSAASTNGANVKPTRANIVGGYLRNHAAYDIYLKIYNKATAPTVGTDTPAATWTIPANGQLYISQIVGAAGYQPGTAGFGFGLTKAYADNDTTAILAGDVDGNFIYL